MMFSENHPITPPSSQLLLPPVETAQTNIDADTYDQARLTAVDHKLIDTALQPDEKVATSGSKRSRPHVQTDTYLGSMQASSSLLGTKTDHISSSDVGDINMSSTSTSAMSSHVLQTLVSDPTTQPLARIATADQEMQHEQPHATYTHEKPTNLGQALKTPALPTRIKGVSKMQQQPQHRAQKSKSPALTDYTIQLMYLEALSNKHLKS